MALDPAVIAPEWGWRAAFLIGGAIGFVVLLLRRFIPESPRWLMTHGRPEEANEVMDGIEARIAHETGQALPPVEGKPLRLRRDIKEWFAPSVRALFATYRKRTILGTALMASPGVLLQRDPVHLRADLDANSTTSRPAASGCSYCRSRLGNFLGPVLLGRLFDSIGRRTMITATYALSGVLMVVTGWMFAHGALTAAEQTAAWTGIFFVASAAASSAYLTVGESFPLEVRAVAIALFYALGTGVGGIAGPVLFGWLIESGERSEIMLGYWLAGALMVAAAGFEAWLGIDAERKSLEDIAPPLSSAEGNPAAA